MKSCTHELLPVLRGIAFDAEGRLYASSLFTHVVLRFDTDSGDFLDVFVAEKLGGLQQPADIEFGVDGHLYVVDGSVGHVKRHHDQTGEYLGQFTQLPNVGGADFLVFIPEPASALLLALAAAVTLRPRRTGRCGSIPRSLEA